MFDYAVGKQWFCTCKQDEVSAQQGSRLSPWLLPNPALSRVLLARGRLSCFLQSTPTALPALWLSVDGWPAPHCWSQTFPFEISILASAKQWGRCKTASGTLVPETVDCFCECLCVGVTDCPPYITARTDDFYYMSTWVSRYHSFPRLKK